VVKSSNSDNLVALPSGTHDVWIYPDLCEPYIDSFSGTTQTLALADEGNVQRFTGAAGCTLSLPAVATLPSGFWFDALNVGTANLTLDPNAAETIEGGASFALYPGQRGRVFYDGSGWRFLTLSPAVDVGGRFGIGTAPVATVGLKVENLGAGNTGVSIKNDDGSGSATLLLWNAKTSTDNIFATFYTEGGSGTLRGSIDYNRGGSAVRYNTTCGAEVKQNIAEMTVEKAAELASAALAIPLKQWEMKDAPEVQTYGLVADDMLAVYPDCVRPAQDVERRDVISRRAVVDAETSELSLVEEFGEPYTVHEPAQYDRSMWIFPLLALCQAQQRQIDALAGDVAFLKAKMGL
jgi:hypothetical protein